MMRPYVCLLLAGAGICLAGFSCTIANAAVTLSWTFDGGDLSIHSATNGDGTLSYKNAETIDATNFGVTGAFPPNLPDGPSGFLRHSDFANGGDAGYQLHYDGVLPNGGGVYVNDFTIIQDVLLPQIAWTPFFNTNPDNGNDADWYVAPDGALGIGHYGYTTAGAIASNAWYRLGFVHDRSNSTVSYWINGANVFNAAVLETDGRFSLYSSLDAIPAHVSLHGEGDGSGNYTNEVYLNNFLFADYAFSSEQMQALGGPTAAPLADPTTSGDKTWGVDAGGLFSVGSNWAGGVAPTGASESVAFTTAISANRTIDVDVAASIISMRFDDDNNYTLAGTGPIRFQAAGPAVANLTVQNTHGNGAHTINTPIEILGDLVITQDSTQPLTIGGPLDAAPTRSITKAGVGTVVAARVRAAALTVNAGSLVIASNGGNSGTSVTDTLDVSGTSRLDLNNNDLVVHATAATKDAVHGDIESEIKSAQNGLDAALITKWDGPGITSSTARTTNVAQGFDLTGLGVIRNSDLNVTIPGSAYTSFSGQAVTPHDVLVKYTYVGDANLSGAVTFDDYVGMDNAFFGLIPNLGWATGDINFDGVINFDDYSKVDQAFFFQGAPLSSVTDGPTAIPEPGTLALALAGLLVFRVRAARPGTKKTLQWPRE
jgi:hypothetical protein